MSLTNQKNLLFSKGPIKSDVNKEATSSPVPLNLSDKKKPLTLTTSIVGVSLEVKNQRLNEAKQHLDKATEFLKTSVFKWSPDHLAAAPYFEKSAGCYAAAGENDLAKQMYLQAANSQQAADTNAAAAVTICKAAQISNSQGNKEECADLYEKAAASWASNGEIDKAGDCFIKAAKAVEDCNSARAWKCYKAASDILFPENTPKERLGSLHPMTVEAVKDALKFLLKSHLIKEALQFIGRVIPLYEAQGYESAMCKAMLTQTILQLEDGDIVKTDQVYLQEHLSNTVYIRSTECRCAELFINAYKSYDSELLEIAQASKDMHFQDHEVQQLARGLSLTSQRPVASSKKNVPAVEKESVWQPLVDPSVRQQNENPKSVESSSESAGIALGSVQDGIPDVQGEVSATLSYSRERDVLGDDEIDLT